MSEATGIGVQKACAGGRIVADKSYRRLLGAAQWIFGDGQSDGMVGDGSDNPYPHLYGFLPCFAAPVQAQFGQMWPVIVAEKPP
jgi:hypothetical protein